MRTFLTKITATFSQIVVLTAAAVMTGLGFAAIAMLAVFAFIAVGIAMLAAPFAAQAAAPVEDAEVIA